MVSLKLFWRKEEDTRAIMITSVVVEFTFLYSAYCNNNLGFKLKAFLLPVSKQRIHVFTQCLYSVVWPATNPATAHISCLSNKKVQGSSKCSQFPQKRNNRFTTIKHRKREFSAIINLCKQDLRFNNGLGRKLSTVM